MKSADYEFVTGKLCEMSPNEYFWKLSIEMNSISFETSLRVKNLVVMMLAFFGRAYSRRLRKTIINSTQAVVVNLGGQDDIHERQIEWR